MPMDPTGEASYGTSGGVELTEALIGRLADEAASGVYEVTGRPAREPVPARSASYAGLQQTVAELRYKGWGFRLISGMAFSAGLCMPPAASATAGGTALLSGPLILMICAAVDDTGGGGPVVVPHPFLVPPEGTCQSWARWLLDRILDVERHETCEAFDVAGWRPFYPEHGPDARLYDVIEREPA